METRIPEQMAGPAPEQGRKRRKPALRIHDGVRSIAIDAMTQTGFTLAVAAPRPKGAYVDVFDGTRHLFHALIVRSGRGGDAPRYDFKFVCDPSLGMPRDYETQWREPAGLIAKS